MRIQSLIAAFLWTLVSGSHAQVAEIAAGATIDSVITQVRNSLNEVISQAEASTSVVGFSVAADANILIQNLNTAANDFRGKLFSDLNKAQQAAFANALKLSKEANRDLRPNIKALQGAVKILGAELSRVPGVSSRPFVHSYTPTYIVNNDASYDFVVDGSLLNSRKSSLMFGSITCKSVSAVEHRLRFQCPAEPFGGGIDWKIGALTLYKEAPFYKFWMADEKYEYKVAAKVIQERLGSYTLTAVETRPASNKVARTIENGYRNGHCSGSAAKVWTYRPAEACTIDVTSIKVNHSKSSNSSYEGVLNASPAGFQVRGVVRNNGSCGPFFKDGRGSLNVTATWTDTCSSQKEAQLEPQTGELHWEQELGFSLSPQTAKFMFVVVQANGERRIVTASESSDWFTSTYDPATKVLLIKPRKVEEAFK